MSNDTDHLETAVDLLDQDPRESAYTTVEAAAIAQAHATVALVQELRRLRP